MATPSAHMEAWWELLVEVPASLADDVGAMCIELGAEGASEDLVPALQAPRDVATLRVSYPTTCGEEEAKSLAAQSFAALGMMLETSSGTWQRRTDTDWAERWKEHFEPLCFAQHTWIVPVWRDFQPPPGAHIIRMDPGMAFGTGQHATTALCLDTLGGAWAAGERPASLLDVGTGSGILALAARAYGVGRVMGIDNDPVAVRVARENAHLNGTPIDFSACPLGDVTERFDCVVANIIAPVLIELAADLLRVVSPRGTLLLSGVLKEQAREVDTVVRALAAAAAREVRESSILERDEWVALRYLLV